LEEPILGRAQGASIPWEFLGKSMVLRDKKAREEEETRKQGRNEIFE